MPRRFPARLSPLAAPVSRTARVARVARAARVACLAGVLLAAGCATPQTGCDCASVSLHCADGERLWARFTDDTAYVNLDHRTLRLQQVPAASGARYTDGRVTVWNRGSEVRIEIGDDPAVVRHCTIAS